MVGVTHVLHQFRFWCETKPVFRKEVGRKPESLKVTETGSPGFQPPAGAGPVLCPGLGALRLRTALHRVGTPTSLQTLGVWVGKEHSNGASAHCFRALMLAHVFNSTLLCCGQGVKIITQRRVPNILRHKGGSVTEKVPLELGTDLWRRASSMKERRAMSIAVAKPSCNTYYGSGGILSAFTCEFIQVL